MNTKELLSAARFAYTRIDDNDIVDFTRLEEEARVQVTTADGVKYYIPDQDVKLSTNLPPKDAGVADVMINAIMPGRLIEDQNVEVSLTIQKLSPLNLSDLRDLLDLAEKDPMQGPL
jgi:hypothetical protein